MSKESKVDFLWEDVEIQQLLSNWESICSKYERIKEIIVESYPKANEESKDFPNKKNCNCFVFFSAVFRIDAILCSHQQNFTEDHFVADIVSLCTTQKSVASQLLSDIKNCAQIFLFSVNKSPIWLTYCNSKESYTVQ